MREFERCTNRPGCNCTPCHRRRVIITLLRTLRNAQETLQRGDSGGKFTPGSKVMSMPAAFHAGSFQELIDALLTLRHMGRMHYWHVHQRYLVSEIMTKNLLNVGGAYYEAVKVEQSWDEQGVLVRWRPGDKVPANVEVLHGIAQPRESVVARAGVRSVLVRAVVEKWNPRVERRPLETALDSLSFMLPYDLRLPSDVPIAA